MCFSHLQVANSKISPWVDQLEATESDHWRVGPTLCWFLAASWICKYVYLLLYFFRHGLRKREVRGKQKRGVENKLCLLSKILNLNLNEIIKIAKFGRPFERRRAAELSPRDRGRRRFLVVF